MALPATAGREAMLAHAGAHPVDASPGKIRVTPSSLLPTYAATWLRPGTQLSSISTCTLGYEALEMERWPCGYEHSVFLIPTQ